MSYSVKEVESKLCEIINQVGDSSYSGEKLVQCEDLTSLGFDSVALMRIVVECEEIFSFEFEEDELIFSKINNFKTLSKIIENKQK